jgi:putative membrane protein
MKTFDWSRPQRQPLAGLAIVFINVLWQIVKGIWPFLILILLQNKPGKIDKYEVIALAFVLLTVVGALLKFYFFRFYIEDNKLIIKHGWIKKVTQIIPLEKIQTVNIEQGPVHQVMNIVKLTVDTAGSERTETKIDALHKTMAEALREQLLSNRDVAAGESAAVQPPIIQLSGSDLLKLSLSANHLETLALIFSFVFGLYENFKDVAGSFFSDIDDYFRDQSLSPLLFLIVAVLLITILVSTARIFFTFYDFKVTPVQKGFRIKSGLFNVKERLIGFQKIQFVSWKANWIRKLMNLWMLEYHVTGGNDIQKKSRVQLPVTRNEFVPLLAREYYSLPQLTDEVFIKIHPSYLWRRILFVALLPTVVLFMPLWFLWGYSALYLLFYTALVSLLAWARYKKFRLWCLDDVAFIKQGWFGQEWILLQWYKIQSVEMKQTIFQRRRGLASLRLYTAAGSISVPFIDKDAANQVVNYALYKIESSKESWM